ncbi:Hypothetical_protein [Hexamita inflata]|uniref:Hypothetical_protein n=1 Tax=Hexamita inflata TaxID=28002 RepID=A0AA86P7C1_9EUKA|nr:Hypothetical protein HINF_LOCUS19464 [Hexamita inflata]
MGYETTQCDLCDQQQIVYGLCSEQLKYSENVNGMYQCVYPFEYVDNECACVTGYLLNNTKCIDVVESLNTISNLISNRSNNQIQLLEQKVEQIENSLTFIDQNIQNNISEIENRILSNFSKSDYNLLMNTSVLDNRINQNITSIKNDILMKQITADANLLTNTTVLDWRIFYNVSQLQNTMNNFNDSLFKQQQIIEQQQYIINNLTQQINCSSNSGYSMVNGSCVQVSCAISGQQSINGICQCVNINSIVQSGSCVCPINSQVVGIACVCSISGQNMQNGFCVCLTTGACLQQRLHMWDLQQQYFKYLQLSKWFQFGKWSLHMLKYICIYFWKQLCLSNIFFVSWKYLHVSKQLINSKQYMLLRSNNWLNNEQWSVLVLDYWSVCEQWSVYLRSQCIKYLKHLLLPDQFVVTKQYLYL